MIFHLWHTENVICSSEAGGGGGGTLPAVPRASQSREPFVRGQCAADSTLTQPKIAGVVLYTTVAMVCGGYIGENQWVAICWMCSKHRPQHSDTHPVFSTAILTLSWWGLCTLCLWPTQPHPSELGKENTITGFSQQQPSDTDTRQIF